MPVMLTTKRVALGMVALGLFCAGFMKLSAQDALHELVVNGGFESGIDDTSTTGWAFDAWGGNGRTSTATRDSRVFHTGTASVSINLPQQDDARLLQVVSVEPDAWYKLEAWVKTEGLQTGSAGATIGSFPEGAVSVSLQAADSWQKIVCYGRTGPDQTRLNFALRVGYFNHTVSGSAWFDDVSVTPVSLLPDNADTIMLFTPKPAAPSDDTAVPAGVSYGLATFFSLAWLVFLWLVFRNWGDNRVLLQKTKMNYVVTLGIIIGIVLVIKLTAAAMLPGYPADVGTFSAWSADVFRLGPAGFYREGYFADYPPAYLYALWLVGAISHLLGIYYGSPVYFGLLKLPAIVVDLGMAWFFYRTLRAQHGERNAFFAALVIVFNPLSFMDSSVWGQVDSVFTMVMLASILEMERKKLPLAAAWFALAVLLKPQALLAAPIALVALIENRKPLEILKSLGVFILCAVLIALPFAINKHPLWIFHLYAGTLGSYDYMTLNAFSLSGLLGGNWMATTETWWGIKLGTWAWISFVPVFALIMYMVFRAKRQGKYWYGAACLFTAFFVLAPKMHERYLFPAAFFMFMAAFIMKSRQVLALAAGLALCSFWNILVTLEVFHRLKTSAIGTEDPSLFIGSLVLFVVFIASLVIGFRHFRRNGKWIETN